MSMPRCVAIYQVGNDFSLPGHIPWGRFPGLESCRLVERQDGTNEAEVDLETTWATDSNYRDWKTAFRSWIRNETKVSLDEPIDVRRERRREDIGGKTPWWRDWKVLWLIVANFGTLVAFFQLLKSQHDWAFVAPDVGLVAPNRHIEAFEGDDLDLELELRNYTRGGSCRVEVTKVELAPVSPGDPSRNVVFVRSEDKYVVPNMLTGDREALHTDWYAKMRGRYQVKVEVAAKAGRWAAAQEKKFDRRMVTIFRDLVAEPARYVRSDGATAVAEIRLPLSHGDRRVRCQLNCVNTNVQLTGVFSRFLPGVVQVEPLDEIGGSRAKWETTTIPSRIVLPVECRLAVRGSAANADEAAVTLTEDQWRDAVACLELFADTIRE